MAHEMVQWYFNESCHDECGYVGEFHDGNGYRGYNIGLERESDLLVPFNWVSHDLTQQNGYHGISWLYSDMI